MPNCKQFSSVYIAYILSRTLLYCLLCSIIRTAVSYFVSSDNVVPRIIDTLSLCTHIALIKFTNFTSKDVSSFVFKFIILFFWTTDLMDRQKLSCVDKKSLSKCGGSSIISIFLPTNFNT